MLVKQNIENLDFPVFEAFARIVDKQYIYICDVKANIWRWSNYAVECFGLPGEYVENLPDIWLEKVHPDDKERVTDVFAKLFSGESDEHSCEYRIRNAQDEYMWVLCRGCMVKDQAGAPEFCAGILTDLGSKNKFDPITGLFSFTEFQIILNEILMVPENHGGILLWGLDCFRRINDAHQYSFGNKLLNAYAKQISEILPADYTFYRMYGDQFAVICPNIAVDEMTNLFNNIYENSISGVKIGNKRQRLSISGGAVFYPENGTQVDEIFTGMEYALEISKKNNRGGLSFFTENLQEKSRYQFQLQQRLRESVLNKCEGFSLCYQPLISSDCGTLVGAEALLRWTNSDFPNISPAEFIPLLEESGDINIVGRWVLSTALLQMQEWLKKRPGMKISINVSYLQLQDPSFKFFVLQEVERNDFPKSQLMLELTESCDVVNPMEVTKELDFFRKQGIQIALDDFGTGYASLSILRDLSADWIKVDHTFVAQIANNNYDQALTEHLINLCKKLGLNVCVEGIETEEIQNIIQRFEPTVLQGYLYSRPVEASLFEKRFVDELHNFEGEV